MALPDGFSPQEHLQDQIRRIWNRDVRDWFSDLDPDNLDPDITTPRQSIYIACKHEEKDSAEMTTQRMLLFSMIKGIEVKTVPIAGIPLGSIHETRRFKPQIFFYFQEDEADIEVGYPAVTGEVSVRILNQDDITPTEAEAYGRKIKTAFGAGGAGHVWRKGKGLLSYRDAALDTWLLSRTAADGREMVTKLLDCVDQTPDWTKAHWKENEDAAAAYPIIPPTQTIYGKARKTPRSRPIADVRFQYAVLHLWGLPNPVCLYDRSGAWKDPLVS